MIGIRDAFRRLLGEVLKHRTFGGFKQPKGRQEYLALERRVSRCAKRSAQLEGNPESPWRLNDFRVLPDQAYLGGGYAFRLQIMGERAHGARAERSDGHKQGPVHPVPLQ